MHSISQLVLMPTSEFNNLIFIRFFSSLLTFFTIEKILSQNAFEEKIESMTLTSFLRAIKSGFLKIIVHFSSTGLRKKSLFFSNLSNVIVKFAISLCRELISSGLEQKNFLYAIRNSLKFGRLSKIIQSGIRAPTSSRLSHQSVR